MGVKDYFKKGDNGNIISPAKSLNDLRVENNITEEHYSSFLEQRERFIPHVDFSSASNFVRYGSAEQYYVDTFKRIYQTYPYDGSLREKVEWHNKSTAHDIYVFDNVYPRTNGYANLSADGWGTLSGSVFEGYGSPGSDDLEYIQIKGGPNKDPNGAISIKSFPGLHEGQANFYDTTTNRESNLRFDLSEGVTVEFWLKKPAFSNAKTEKEVIFDMWNGYASSSVCYGRMTIELSGVASGSPFYVTVQSGSGGGTTEANGYYQQAIGANVTTSSLTDWNHFAFTFVSSSSDVETKFYLNGVLNQTLKTGTSFDEVTGSLMANLGALRATPSGNIHHNQDVIEGHGKLSGSLDEFRFWKTKRTSKDIGQYWFTQVDGGTNTDVAFSGALGSKYNFENKVDLGVYYKFNEGITLTSSVDSTVLDYSGRISNGNWVGYLGSQSRDTGSAMVLASASTSEFKDPIIYSYHRDVSNLLTSLQGTGSDYDINNNASIYNSLPSWILEEDEDAQTTKKLVQIIGSYFDTLHIQIENLPSIKTTDYVSSSFKPLPFSKRVLANQGLRTGDILSEIVATEEILNRDDDREFAQKIYDLKNNIYKNIYSNLSFIYKSKGTEKSFRNLLRCVGIDDEIVKLNLYGDGVEHELRDTYRTTSHRKNFVAFNKPSRFEATVFQSASTDTNSALSYISGSDTAVSSSEADFWLPWTAEAEVIFPAKMGSGLDGHYLVPFQSSSLFGAHEAGVESSDFTWATGDNNNFQVYSVRDRQESNHVYFVLTSSLAGWPTLTSSLFYDIYENQKWNFAVRYYIDKTSNSGLIKGGQVNDIVKLSDEGIAPYIEFYGVNMALDQVINEFHISGALTIDGDPDPLTTTNKRFYIGAHKENFTGSTLAQTDVKISSLRYWQSYLSNEVIKAHAQDSSNYGVERPYENIGLLKTSLSATHVPAIETLAMHWNFDTVTGSDASGEFIVQDYSSGSVALTSRYGWLGNIVKSQHVGKGVGFPASDTGSISTEFIYSAKQMLPEAMSSHNMVNILTQDDEIYTRDSRPIKYYHAVEKSMYQTISEEMINFFATIVDFNNLIGEPVNRYRQDYKDLGKLRQLFYERVGNTPSFERYINLYKWIDNSITNMLSELMPASANSSEKIRNLVESHVLERNKYWTKFPTLEMKQSDPEAGIFSITEMLYDWQHGHAPLSNDQADNRFWWRERAERSNSNLTSGDAAIDERRDIFNDADKHQSASLLHLHDASTTYLGSTYARERFSKPYHIRGSHNLPHRPARPAHNIGGQSLTLHGGHNFPPSKILNYAAIATQPFGDLLRVESSPGSGIFVTASVNYLLVEASDMASASSDNDEIFPVDKKTSHGFARSNREYLLASGYEGGKTDQYLPFSIYSSSVATGYAAEVAASKFGSALPGSPGIDFTNIHYDSYGTDHETPLQGPFTEKFVGGRQHRHLKYNISSSRNPESNGLDNQTDRPEAWYMLLGAGDASFALVGTTYTTTGEYDKDTPRAARFRSEHAKRPINIRNILQTTGSTKDPDKKEVHDQIGNYEKNWNIVSLTSRTQNSPYWKDNGGFTLPDRLITDLPATTHIHTMVATIATGSPGNIFGAVPTHTNYPGLVSNRIDSGSVGTIFALPRRDLTGSDSVIVSRFSAPGGPEINSRGYLDIIAEEYSVHNALPFRNLTVRGSGSGEDGLIRMSVDGQAGISHLRDREGLRTRLTRHSGRFGFDGQWGSITWREDSSDEIAAFHKVNRNPIKRIKEQ